MSSPLTGKTGSGWARRQAGGCQLQVAGCELRAEMVVPAAPALRPAAARCGSSTRVYMAPVNGCPSGRVESWLRNDERKDNDGASGCARIMSKQTRTNAGILRCAQNDKLNSNDGDSGYARIMSKTDNERKPRSQTRDLGHTAKRIKTEATQPFGIRL